MDNKGGRERPSKRNQIVLLEGSDLKAENQEKIDSFPSTKLDFSVMAKAFNRSEIWDDRTNAEIRRTFALNFLFGLLPAIILFRKLKIQLS